MNILLFIKGILTVFQFQTSKNARTFYYNKSTAITML
jgi:hypothetical protein